MLFTSPSMVDAFCWAVMYNTKLFTFICVCVCVCARARACILVAQSCPTLCDPIDCSLLGSSVHGILQTRILEWVAISFSRISSHPMDGTRVPCIAGRFFTIWAPREALYVHLHASIFLSPIFPFFFFPSHFPSLHILDRPLLIPQNRSWLGVLSAALPIKKISPRHCLSGLSLNVAITQP